MGKGKAPEPARVELTIMRCGGCRALGVAIGLYRITSHKCGGGWDFIHEESVLVSDVLAGLPKRPLSKKDGNQ